MTRLMDLRFLFPQEMEGIIARLHFFISILTLGGTVECSGYKITSRFHEPIWSTFGAKMVEIHNLGNPF